MADETEHAGRPKPSPPRLTLPPRSWPMLSKTGQGDNSTPGSWTAPIPLRRNSRRCFSSKHKKAGAYTEEYSVTDSEENHTETIRTVRVEKPESTTPMTFSDVKPGAYLLWSSPLVSGTEDRLGTFWTKFQPLCADLDDCEVDVNDLQGNGWPHPASPPSLYVL